MSPTWVLAVPLVAAGRPGRLVLRDDPHRAAAPGPRHGAAGRVGGRGGLVRALVALPTDYGVQCYAFLLLGAARRRSCGCTWSSWSPSAGYLVLALVKWYRELRRPRGADPTPDAGAGCDQRCGWSQRRLWPPARSVRRRLGGPRARRRRACGDVDVGRSDARGPPEAGARLSSGRRRELVSRLDVARPSGDRGTPSAAGRTASRPTGRLRRAVSVVSVGARVADTVDQDAEHVAADRVEARERLGQVGRDGLRDRATTSAPSVRRASTAASVTASRGGVSRITRS